MTFWTLALEELNCAHTVMHLFLAPCFFHSFIWKLESCCWEWMFFFFICSNLRKHCSLMVWLHEQYWIMALMRTLRSSYRLSDWMKSLWTSKCEPRNPTSEGNRSLDHNRHVYNQVIDWIGAIYWNGLRLFNIHLNTDLCSRNFVYQKATEFWFQWTHTTALCRLDQGKDNNPKWRWLWIKNKAVKRQGTNNYLLNVVKSPESMETISKMIKSTTKVQNRFVSHQFVVYLCVLWIKFGGKAIILEKCATEPIEHHAKCHGTCSDNWYDEAERREQPDQTWKCRFRCSIKNESKMFSRENRSLHKCSSRIVSTFEEPTQWNRVEYAWGTVNSVCLTWIM